MFQPKALLQLRLLIASMFVVASLIMPLGVTAQASGSFVLTGAVMRCNDLVLDLTWQNSGEVVAIAVSVTNSSIRWVDNADVANPNSVNSFSMTVTEPGATQAFVRATIAGDPNRVYEYTAALGPCGTPSTIGGGLVSEDTETPEIPITISNLTCTGFDWRVTAPYEVRVYVSVMDIIGEGMIPYVPVNGTDLARSESYTVTTENQTWFSVLIAVHNLDTNEELARKSMSKECPIASETPTVTPSVTPDVTPSVTPDVDDETVTIIQIEMPNGESIEGAPFQVFAPSAAMQAGPAPLQTGVVGANNTITLNGLIEGQYRIVISPVGMDVIDFTFAVGTEPVTQLLAVVNADGTVTVTSLQTGPAPTATAPTTAPTTEPVAPTTAPGGSATDSGDSVSGLPSTGTGEAQAAPSVWVIAGATALMAGLSLAVIRRSATSR